MSIPKSGYLTIRRSVSIDAHRCPRSRPSSQWCESAPRNEERISPLEQSVAGRLRFGKAATVVLLVFGVLIIGYAVATYAVIRSTNPRVPYPSNCTEIMSSERSTLNHVARSIAVEKSARSNARYTLYYAAIYYHLVLFWSQESIEQMVECPQA